MAELQSPKRRVTLVALCLSPLLWPGTPAFAAGIGPIAQVTTPRAVDTNEDPADRVNSISDEVDRISKRFNSIQESYRGTGGLGLTYDLKKRYDEALYLYLIEDYERGALLFFTIVDRASPSTFSQYSEAEWYLAESLFLAENYFPALEFYTRIVQTGASHPFYESAVVRMIETFSATGDRTRFEAYYQTYMSAGKSIASTEKIDYALGKNFFQRRDYDRTITMLAPIAAGEGTYAPLAEYIVAACYVSKKDMDKAIETFQKLLERSINTPEQRDVEELAWLALGRIYQEKGEYDKALDAYRSISRYSDRFTESLYEMAQTYYNKGDVDQAIRTIDILLLTSPDSIDAPSLKLKRGHMLQKRLNYTEALDTYERLIAEYSSIKDELDVLMKERTNVLQYFEQLVSSDLSRIDSDMLIPQLAIRYATEDKQMARALEVSRALRKEESDLIEADRLIQDIEQAINGREPHDVVLSLKRLRVELRQIQDKLMIAQEQLVASEYRYLERNLSGVERRRLDETGITLDGLPQLARELPEMERDKSELIEVYEDQVQEVDRNLYKLEELVEDQLAQAAAIEKYLGYTRAEQGIDPDTEQSTRQRLTQERQELEGALKELEQIRRDLLTIQVRDTLLAEGTSREDSTRSDAQKRLASYRDQLRPLRTSVGGKDAEDFFADVDKTQASISQMLNDMQAFFKTVDELEVQELARINRELLAEKSRLSQYAQQVTEYSDEARVVSEEIAYQSFSQIQKEFSNLILNANVGIINVYWEQKETKDREIEELQTERSEGIRLLQEQFSSLKANDQ